MLFVFQCTEDPGVCSTWESGAGANSAFVLEPEELTHGITTPARPTGPPDPEVRVLRWTLADDGIPVALERAFYSEERFLALPDDIIMKQAVCTRTGSVPVWMQGPMNAPPRPWRFAMQIAPHHPIPSAPSDPTECGFYFVHRDGDRQIVEAPERPLPGIPRHIHVDDEGVAVDGANFGDGGVGYVFLRDDDGDGPPMALFFWDCL